MPRAARPSSSILPRSCPPFVPFLLLFLIGGCSVWDSASSYFNTYYNAQRLFAEAEDEVWIQPEVKFLGRDFLAPCIAQGTTKAKLTSVIEKCSKLLEYHPGSNLVDDALMMIGKASFYQGEYRMAERKFKELIEGFPEGGLVLEARLMLGYTYFKLNDQEQAAAVAAQVVETGTREKEHTVVAGASLILARIELEKMNYAAAREHFQRAADLGESSQQRSAAFLNVASIDSLTGSYEDAEKEYRLAEQTSTTYVGEYRGKIGSIRMLTKMGQYGVSREQLHALRSNPKYREFFGEIDLEIGNAYRDEGDYPSAVAQYTYVDTLYARQETAVDAAYELGLIYETKMLRYDSARAVYTRHKGVSVQAAVTPLLIRKADYLTRYAAAYGELFRADSQRTSLLAVRDTVSLSRDTTARDSALALGKKDSIRTSRLSALSSRLDSIDARRALYESEIASLFFTDVGRLDSATFWYRHVLDQFPSSASAPRALFVLAQIYSQDSTASPGLTDSLYREIVRRFPRSEFAAEADHLLGGSGIQQESDPAGGLYAQAEGVLLRGEHKAAVDLFTSIVAQYPASPYASRAQYAIGWIYEQLTLQPDSAIVQYKKLVTLYPGSSYAAVVQPRLAEVELAKKQAASAKDTVGQREEKKQNKPVDDNQPPRQTTEQKRLKPEEDIVPPKKNLPTTPVDGPGP